MMISWFAVVPMLGVQQSDVTVLHELKLRMPLQETYKPDSNGEFIGPYNSGLTKVKASKATYESTTIEIEGICKVTENEVSCWRPDGKRDKALTTDVAKYLDSQKLSVGALSLRYKKRNRILVYKTIYAPNLKGGVYGMPDRQSSLMPDQFREGWDQIGVNHQAVDMKQGSFGVESRYFVMGMFEQKTKSFPFRFSLDLNAVKGASIPATTGGILDIGGNSFGFGRITTQPKEQGPIASNSLGTRTAKVSSYFNIQTREIGNPFLSISLMPINDKKEPIQYVDVDGNPLTFDEYNKLATARKSSFDVFGTMITPMMVDPGRSEGIMRSGFTQHFPIDPLKISGLEVSIMPRKVFEFEIPLDPR